LFVVRIPEGASEIRTDESRVRADTAGSLRASRAAVRRPRRRKPGQLLDITIRCHRSEFRFLPEKERNDVLGFWLAKAQKKCPGILLLAICNMSNHIHLTVEDRCGEISRFMQYALGHAAKRINKLDRVRGAVFERRFAEIVILDRDALVKRIAYAITNPVEANLVRSHRDWTGLCLFAGEMSARYSFTAFHDGRYQRALDDSVRTGANVDRSEFFESAELEIAGVDHELAARIEEAIEHRERELRKSQNGVLGIERVLNRSPFDRPKMSKRSAMPLCFASTRELRAAFVNGWRAFVAAFRKASSDFRAGVLDVRFPMFSFRPSTAAS
jgi:REP element-mobilizing transposase RayT